MESSRTLSLVEFRALVERGEPTDGVVVRAVTAAAVREVSAERRRLRFVISSEAVDRAGDVIKVDGWRVDRYLRNPVVLWAHQYSMPPIAVATRVWREGGELLSEADFIPGEVYPFAGSIYELYRRGFLRAVSVGFRPIEWRYNEERRGVDFFVQELLEYSAVPVPANPEALVVGSQAPSAKGVVPSDVSDQIAPEDTPWSAPTLADFTEGSWDELTAAERRRIAGHYAWAPAMPPERFTDLKLPHHRPSDGAVVWRGVFAAAQRLDQLDIPADDLARVRAHLARHYRQFDREPPWERSRIAVRVAEQNVD